MNRNGRADVGGALDVLVASVADHRVAFRLDDVAEVLAAAAPVELPDAPAVIRGLLNLHGTPLPILDLRARLGLPPRPADPDDHVLVCGVAGRAVGVWVDRADDVRRLEADTLVPLDDHTPARHFAGAAPVDDGMLLVSDVESFLSPGELSTLDQALDRHAEDRDEG